ncbi:helix-turn-helix domain-containing protein [Salipaludibacillus sp. CF4.18]|uniref:helix-turn-helix domain-containing protein n=1 Tax=Salipaludibacillus sp. CF4.18 TaxID=3373081 RepID=UPI003EE5DD71
MQPHFITNLLGIKDAHVHVFDSGEDMNDFWFELYTTVRKQTCPPCLKRIHSYREQKIQGDRISGKRVDLYVKKRRYRCLACRYTFFEKLSFLNRYQRQTTMVEQEVLGLCTEMSFHSVARIKGISANRCLRLFDQREISVRKGLYTECW